MDGGVIHGQPAIMIYGAPELFTKSDKQRTAAAIEEMGLIPGDVFFSAQACQSKLSQGQQDEVDKARRLCDVVDKLLADGKPAKALKMAQKALEVHQRIFKPDHWDIPW
jgi:ABC-type phosphate/phosphonate transport system ATPase subunit